jgi:predicted 3-demethylubiquinone-9 3-methyltransferase (glyoxalase superfamily)
MQKIVTCIWFDGHVQEALDLYTSLLPDSRVLGMSRYAADAQRPAGEILSANFTMQGQEFMLLNGGPGFPHSEAMSLQIFSETQDEIDRLWAQLTEGGRESQCGWLVDRFGVHWQIVPTVLGPLMSDPDPERARRVTEALMGMVKLDIAALERAHRGE